MFHQLGSRWTFPDLRRQMDRVFEQVMEPAGNSFFGARAFPALNVWADNDCVFVEAELPGVAMNEIEINVVGGELSIKGVRKQTPTGNGSANVTLHRQERAMGEFSRFLTLPEPIDAEKVEAVLRDGVLTIKLPKAETAKPRRIAVQTRS